MPKLCEVVAVVKDRKAAGERALTEANKLAQKPALFEGRIRTYTPAIDGGSELPTESSPAELSVKAMLDTITDPLVRLFDTTRMQDEGNTVARADIIVEAAGGIPGFILGDVPATHLLYLEKLIGDVLTFVRNLPVCDPSVDWQDDPETELRRSQRPISKARTSKEPKVIVKYHATDHHPAQTELVHIDEIVGTWEENRFTGAIPANAKAHILDRVMALRDAIRQARERANSQEINPFTEGKEIMDFIFG